MFADDPHETMRRVVENLEGEYGAKRNRSGGDPPGGDPPGGDPPGGDPLDELILTILSQQNSSASTRAVFAKLKRRFPAWDDAVDAPVAEIEEAIRSGGLATMKAARIKRLLESVRDERGSLDLRFVRKMDEEAALGYLTGFSGVGPKTARCTLLFAFGMDVFPMDVHIFRILERLGLLDPKTPDERAHREMSSLVPRGKHYSAHVNLIEHGRKICRPTAPRCDACCLLDYCPTGHERLSRVQDEDPRGSLRMDV